MRNDFTQVETREIADSELDNISGGVGVTAAATAGDYGVATGVDGAAVVGAAETTVAAVPVDQITQLVNVQTTGI
ncbi:hypothetical protein [Streptomyces gobiensis]|uniref:hypothetical protein n=1 Tax=Streptomyces gobiensis TaxID=2875706 RepID=UPI001E43FD63|nr:hypothetical protein [Streptomyces gobiensis]UGY93209.1 hypothetical protein test1122_16805 [Streptomyces gobiensis]